MKAYFLHLFRVVPASRYEQLIGEYTRAVSDRDAARSEAGDLEQFRAEIEALRARLAEVQAECGELREDTAELERNADLAFFYRDEIERLRGAVAIAEARVRQQWEAALKAERIALPDGGEPSDLLVRVVVLLQALKVAAIHDSAYRAHYQEVHAQLEARTLETLSRCDAGGLGWVLALDPVDDVEVEVV